jgi:hypothetical protein
VKDQADVSRLLNEPFPATAIKQRQGGGQRTFSYVEGHTVIHRLNDATDNEWDLEIVGVESVPWGSPDTLLYTAHVRVTIPGLGSRDGLGVQLVKPSQPGSEDMAKGAVTDAIKVAAKNFGVGLHLWGPDYGAGEVEARSPQPKSVVNGQEIATRGEGNAEKWGENEAWVADGLSEGQGKAIFAIGKAMWEMAGMPGKYNEGDYLLGEYGVADKNKLSKREASSLIDEMNKKQQQMRQSALA